MVSVIGLGRSGTNLVGQILKSHPQIKCDIEASPQFGMAVSVVVDKVPIAPLLSLYRAKQYGTNLIYATKDHPSIWLVEQIRPLDAKFICIERDPYQCIASSLKHQGVLDWVTGYYPDNPLSGNYVPGYSELSTLERLTLRWVINHQRIVQLQETNKGDILFLGYSDLVVNPVPVLKQMQRFLNLDTEFDVPLLDKKPLSKYIYELSGNQLDIIKRTLQKYENVLCLPG